MENSDFLKKELEKEIEQFKDPYNEFRNGYDPRDINGPNLDSDWQ
jgi:hypothetical protein